MSVIGDEEFSAKLSIARVALLEASLLVLIFIPFTTFVEENAVYARFLIISPFKIITVICSILLFIIFLAIIPVLWWALIGRPSLIITSEKIAVLGIYTREINLEDINSLEFNSRSGCIINYKHNKNLSIPIILFRNRLKIIERLESLRSQIALEARK